MYYYKHHIGDYRRDTSHLTLLEHGIYRQLLDLYYITERPLDANALRLINARTTEEKEAAKQILKEFFVLENGVYVHKRCEDEIVKYHDKSGKASASAKARWNKNNDLQDANALRTECEQDANHKPLTKNQRTKKTLCTLEEYINQCKQEGRAVIPEDDKVFEFATNANIPLDFLRVAWVAFRDEHLEKGDKKQSDWVQTFRNYVRNDYVKVWAFNKDGECYLTTKGKQIASDMEKKENERAK